MRLKALVLTGLFASMIGFAPPPAYAQGALSHRASNHLGGRWFGEAVWWFCGPAATQIALDAMRASGTNKQEIPGQVRLGNYLQATWRLETTSAERVMWALNAFAKTKWFEYKQIDLEPTQEQKDRLRRDIVYNIDRGYPLVVNLWLPARNGPWPEHYPHREVFHFVTVVGYEDQGATVIVRDPAAQGAASGDYKDVPQEWKTSTDQLAVWIGGRGYAA